VIKEKELEEIRQILKKSRKTLFFFDDDPDGLCSYLLLRKYTGQGRGIIIKSSPILTDQYVRKIHEYNPDLVVVLDKPMISQEFMDMADKKILWIDHHPLQKKISDNVVYYNPHLHKPEDNRPTSYWCYRVTQENLWLAMVGMVGDWFLPEFTEDFAKQHPELLHEVKDPGEALYDTQFGTLTRMFAFILKGKTSEINKCIRTLEKIDSPYEILEQQTPKGRLIYRYYKRINDMYERLLKRAVKKATKSPILFFKYTSKTMSFTGDLANELIHRYPNKVIIIGRDKGDRIIMSIRSHKLDLPPIIEKAVSGLDGYGGGHSHACGGNVSKEDFYIFLERFKRIVKEKL